MLKETKDFIDTFEPKLPLKPTEKLALVISFIFHPVFMPTILFYAMYKFVPASFAELTSKEFGLRLLMVFMNTAFFPILSVFLMKALGFVESIHLYKPRDRYIPLVVCMILYFTTYYFFKQQNAPFLLLLLLLGSYWNLVALFIINIFFKVSMHTTGAGGMIGMLIALMFVSPISLTLPLFLGLLIAGMIGTARMLLRAHHASEIWMGYALGIIVQLSAYWYLS
ncbi:MAG: hypothetical protein K0R82_2217 [Flavipsychrobacter sp.]|nr:hypothetical protein [Flavipsychrobacter sp.]